MATAPTCIFCRIIAGQIPAHELLRTDHGLAFLDIAPLAPGHVLLIPTKHYAHLEDVPPEVLGHVCGVLPALVRAVMAATGSAGCNVLQNNHRVAGQLIDHVHWHIIPRQAEDGLGYRWNPREYAEGQAEQLREQLLASLQGG